MNYDLNIFPPLSPSSYGNDNLVSLKEEQDDGPPDAWNNYKAAGEAEESQPEEQGDLLAIIGLLRKELEELKESTDNDYAIAIAMAAEERKKLEHRIRRLEQDKKNLKAEKKVQRVHIDYLTRQLVTCLEEKEEGKRNTKEESRPSRTKKTKKSNPVEGVQLSFATWRNAAQAEIIERVHAYEEPSFWPDDVANQDDLEEVEEAFEHLVTLMRPFQTSKRADTDKEDSNDLVSMDSISLGSTWKRPSKSSLTTEANYSPDSNSNVITNLKAILQALQEKNENLQESLVQEAMDRKKQQSSIWSNLYSRILPKDLDDGVPLDVVQSTHGMITTSQEYHHMFHGFDDRSSRISIPSH